MTALPVPNREKAASRTLEQKLQWATERLALWEDRRTAADARYARAREMGGGIPGFGGSGNQRAAQQVRNAYASADRAAREVDEKIAHYSQKVRAYERRIAERDRERLTVSDVAGATHVRIGRSWHKVVRVNAKSVTVETGYSWTDRYALDKILEVRTIA